PKRTGFIKSSGKFSTLRLNAFITRRPHSESLVIETQIPSQNSRRDLSQLSLKVIILIGISSGSIDVIISVVIFSGPLPASDQIAALSYLLDFHVGFCCLISSSFC